MNSSVQISCRCVTVSVWMCVGWEWGWSVGKWPAYFYVLKNFVRVSVDFIPFPLPVLKVSLHNADLPGDNIWCAPATCDRCAVIWASCTNSLSIWKAWPGTPARVWVVVCVERDTVCIPVTCKCCNAKRASCANTLATQKAWTGPLPECGCPSSLSVTPCAYLSTPQQELNRLCQLLVPVESVDLTPVTAGAYW